MSLVHTLDNRYGVESVVAKSVWLKISRNSHIQFYFSCSTSLNKKNPMITADRSY